MAADLSQDINPNRLLVLSHQLARHVPAIFSEHGATYFDAIKSPVPMVIVFDIFDTFDNEIVPEFCETHHQEWIISDLFDEDIALHCQQARNLYNYYKYRDQNSIYFYSFICIGVDTVWNDPVLIKPVPVACNGELAFRTVIQGGLEWFFAPRDPKLHWIIMIPPHVHPFMITDVKGDVMSVIDFEHDSMNVSIKDTHFARVLRPNRTIQSLLCCHGQRKSSGQFGNFRGISRFNCSKEQIDAFFTSAFLSQKSFEKLGMSASIVSVLEEAPASIEQIVSEQVEDPEEAEEIAELVQKCKRLKPRKKWEVKNPRPLLNTFYNFEWSFGTVRSPSWTRTLIDMGRVNYSRIAPPKVLVRKDGMLTRVDATSVIDDWERERYRPVCGTTKSLHCVIFTDCSSLEDAVILAFMRNLSHTYSSLGFGEMILGKEAELIRRCIDVQSSVTKMLKDDALIEFRSFPTVAFLLTNSHMQKEFRPHCHICKVATDMVCGPRKKYLQQIAFDIYAEIRMFQGSSLSVSLDTTPAPMPCPLIESLFFGLRYDHPFLLERQDNGVLTLHIAWDMKTGISVWTDDTGSSLEKYALKDVAALVDIISGARDILAPVVVTFTIAILGDGLTEEQIAEFAGLRDCQLMTIIPRPAVQCSYLGDFPDDCIIQGESEVTTCNCKEDLCSCVIVSEDHVGYCVRLYMVDGHPEEEIVKLVTNFSQLSWLSCKPGCERRVTAFPPHLATLIQEIGSEFELFANFEFLP